MGVQELFNNEKSEEVHVKIKDASNDNKKKQGNYKRANTNVGIMNKFILQFSRVEKAYRLVEESFIFITKSAKSKSLQERMKRKCNMKFVKPILSHLGFGADCFTNNELQQIFDKSPESEQDISFQRLLIGVGLCYFAKLEKEQNAKKSEKENSGTEIEYDNDGTVQQQNVILPDDMNESDEKEQSAENERFEVMASGFIVVKTMFDTIDEDGSGEISLQEFEHSFNEICRDPEIVKKRMNELDYNHDQNVSFREFLFGISSWCGDNDDGDNDLDKKVNVSEE